MNILEQVLAQITAACSDSHEQLFVVEWEKGQYGSRACGIAGLFVSQEEAVGWLRVNADVVDGDIEYMPSHEQWHISRPIDHDRRVVLANDRVVHVETMCIYQESAKMVGTLIGSRIVCTY